MKLINSNVEYLYRSNDLLGIKSMIELAGRTCYKSEDKITDDSCEEFVQRMINSGHMSMLEHGTVYLTVFTNGEDTDVSIIAKYMMNQYSMCVYDNETDAYYITTNYRVIVENGWEDDLKYLAQTPTDHHIRRYTFRITCDRGVSHEIVRHRCLSFAQESTRYCNYSKDKFDNEITYIIPTKLEDKLQPGQYVYWDDDWCDLNEYKIMYPCNNDDIDVFLQQLNTDEITYIFLTNEGWKPQEARQILPNALKTEIIVTGFAPDFAQFIKLRSAKNAHPDIQKIANMIKEQIGYSVGL